MPPRSEVGIYKRKKIQRRARRGCCDGTDMGSVTGRTDGCEHAMGIIMGGGREGVSKEMLSHVKVIEDIGEFLKSCVGVLVEK